METKNISAKSTKLDKEASVNYPMPTSLQEAVEMFGEKEVFTAAMSSVTIDLQSLIRRGIVAGKTAEEIQSLASNWKPGVKVVVGSNAVATVLNQAASMSAEDLQDLINKLQAAQGQVAAPADEASEEA